MAKSTAATAVSRACHGFLFEWDTDRMRAVRIHAKQDMRMEQVPSPEPGADEVRLRVGYVGICGSDLHYYADGAAGIFAIRQPLIPGHEVSGVVDFAMDADQSVERTPMVSRMLA